MDNNNNINPEIISETPVTDAAIELGGAVIPEINTIEPINEIADTVIEEAVVAEAVAVEETVAEAAEETAVAVEETVAEAAEETVIAAEESDFAVAVEEPVVAAVEPAAAVERAPVPVVEGVLFDQQPEINNAVPEAFPDGSAPMVYAAADHSQPTDAPYYAAADDYTMRSEKGEGFALTAFILGLGSLVLTWGSPMCYVCIAAAITAIIFATVARKKGAVNSFQKSGLTMAIIGLILSLITSVSCTACDACATGFGEAASSEIFSQLEDGDFNMDALQQFVEQYGDPEDVEEFNQALEQLQGFNYGE